MKKIIALCIVSVLCLSGCSDKSNESTSDNMSTTSSASEITDSAGDASNTTDATDRSENNAGDSDAKTESGSASNKTVQTNSDNGSISGGELPVLTEEISKDSADSKSETKPSERKNTSPSSETETQTTASEQENGSVIELPLIPVE